MLISTHHYSFLTATLRAFPFKIYFYLTLLSLFLFPAILKIVSNQGELVLIQAGCSKCCRQSQKYLPRYIWMSTSLRSLISSIIFMNQATSWWEDALVVQERMWFWWKMYFFMDSLIFLTSFVRIQINETTIPPYSLMKYLPILVKLAVKLETCLSRLIIIHTKWLSSSFILASYEKSSQIEIILSRYRMQVLAMLKIKLSLLKEISSSRVEVSVYTTFSFFPLAHQSQSRPSTHIFNYMKFLHWKVRQFMNEMMVYSVMGLPVCRQQWRKASTLMSEWGVRGKFLSDFRK